MVEEREPMLWALQLPWDKPPLSLNDRLHYREHARRVSAVRWAGHALARQQRIPRLASCTVELVYVPRDSRRRDEDNLVATLKPLCDGLVDAGVVADDTPGLMRKLSPRILPPDGRPRLWLRVEEGIAR